MKVVVVKVAMAVVAAPAVIVISINNASAEALLVKQSV